MRPATVSLITDFGTRDHFVGVMKGVLLSRCPHVTLVDITHEVAAFDVAAGAFVLAQAYRWFPERTIHLVVVDPGVGTDRRALVARLGTHCFVAPDNGVLSVALPEGSGAEVRVIEPSLVVPSLLSQTFHGRDLFAPVAAELARGASLEAMGERAREYVMLDCVTPRRVSASSWRGAVLYVDHFGNLVTNFSAAEVPPATRGRFRLRVAAHSLDSLAQSYAEVRRGELLAIYGSSGYLEISVNQGSASRLLSCTAGAVVELDIDV